MRIDKTTFFNGLRSGIEKEQKVGAKINVLLLLLIYETGADIIDLQKIKGSDIKQNEKTIYYTLPLTKRKSYITPNIDYVLTLIPNYEIISYTKLNDTQKYHKLKTIIKKYFNGQTSAEELQEMCFINMFNRGASFDNILEIYPYSKNLEMNKHREFISKRLKINQINAKDIMTVGLVDPQIISIMELATTIDIKNQGDNKYNYNASFRLIDKNRKIRELKGINQHKFSKYLNEKYNTNFNNIDISYFENGRPLPLEKEKQLKKIMEQEYREIGEKYD